MRACDDELGIERHQVNRSQMMAPASAARTTYSSSLTSTRPAAMVIATLSLVRAPMKFMAALMMMAARSGSALV